MRRRLISLFAALTYFLLAASPSQAARAVMKQRQMVCRDLADVKRSEALAKGGDTSAWVAFEREKVRSGACKLYQEKGAIILDEEREGYACVRPPGDFECLWTPQWVVNDHPGYIALKPRPVHAPPPAWRD